MTTFVFIHPLYDPGGLKQQPRPFRWTRLLYIHDRAYFRLPVTIASFNSPMVCVILISRGQASVQLYAV